MTGFRFASRLLMVSVLALTVAACQNGFRATNVTNPTVGDQSLDEQPYALAERHAQNQRFAEVNSRIDTLNRKVDAIQREVRALKSEVAPQPIAAPSVPVEPVARMDAKPVVTPAPVPLAAAPKAAPKPTPAPAPKAPAKQVVTNGVAGSTLEVTNLRVGEEANHTRIVLDLNGAGKIRHDLDNTERLLILEVPGAKWSAENARTLTKSKLVSSFQRMEGTNQIAIQLKAPVTVRGTAALTPDAAHSVGHRAYIDLVAQ